MTLLTFRQELLTPHGLYNALQLPQLSTLKRIEVWQRNGGSNNGTRLTYGFLEDIFHSIRHWKLVTLLIERGIHIGTGWESRLISGGSIGKLIFALKAMSLTDCSSMLSFA